MICAFCPASVDTNNPDNYVEVSSWVNGPKLDGPKLREHTGRVAHKKCVENLVNGQAADQPELFEEKPQTGLSIQVLNSSCDDGGCDPCPGIARHCNNGEHCTYTDASCAVSQTYDPCNKCCICRQVMKK